MTQGTARPFVLCTFRAHPAFVSKPLPRPGYCISHTAQCALRPTPLMLALPGPSSSTHNSKTLQGMAPGCSQPPHTPHAGARLAARLSCLSPLDSQLLCMYILLVPCVVLRQSWQATRLGASPLAQPWRALNLIRLDGLPGHTPLSPSSSCTFASSTVRVSPPLCHGALFL